MGVVATGKKIPAPIEHPIAKAYLREFEGWSTAYPPGMSDPASIRDMGNIWITRDGAAQIRPALRSIFTEDVFIDTSLDASIVGGFEPFFLNNGDKAFLFATREALGHIRFRVAVYNIATQRYDIRSLTDPTVGFSIPQTEAQINFTGVTSFIKYLQIDNKILALSDASEDLRIFSVGETKKVRRVTSITKPEWDPADNLSVIHPEAAWINTATKVTIPTAETPTADTLISSGDNDYNYGYFYTFENEVGESAASQIVYLTAARGWSQWRFLQPDVDGNPTTIAVNLPEMAMDQLVGIVPEAVFDAALLEGALRWNLYMFTWSDQSVVPVEGLLVGSRELTPTSTWQEAGWIQNTPAISVSSFNAPLPNENNRYNYSELTGSRQGLVVGDRVVLVNDRDNLALIRWSSNQIGEYLNFTPSRGGGFKTLSSGNLQVPISVKLWQNPQSVDTITILCNGVDGNSTAYYMAPAEVAGQSQSDLVMGFEETTATPGTVSPYGVEVFNNALYHPLDTELMKSTASNYNINHTTITENISNKWLELLNKNQIVSAQYDNRLYFLVHNPDGEPRQTGCFGNEIWIYDAGKEGGSWSRWLVQGIALHRLEVNGKLYLSIVRPEGIFIFDHEKLTDDISTPTGTAQRAIPWFFETNIQGGNRAHDVWVRLQQANVVLGNWRGKCRYGLRGHDVNGKLEVKEKIYTQVQPDPTGPRPMPTDIEDYLLIRRDLKEWVFFASSIEEEGETVMSKGQFSLVQYTITPRSVNTHREFGSVETFSYDRDTRGWATRTDNGVPQTYIDTRRYP